MEYKVLIDVSLSLVLPIKLSFLLVGFSGFKSSKDQKLYPYKCPGISNLNNDIMSSKILLQDIISLFCSYGY